MKKDNLEFLKSLMETPTPTGDEGRGVEVFNKHMSQFSEPVFVDHFNNSVFKVGVDQGKRIMISGHIDELAYIIVEVLDSGFARIARTSGEDKRVLPGSKLQVLCDDGKSYIGVISSKPIHVATDKEYSEVAEVSDFLLDLGCTNKEEVEGLGIRVGTLCVYPKGESQVEFGPGKDFVMGPGTDDKVGVYITSEVLRRMNGSKALEKNHITLFGAAMGQEETGLRGAKVCARKVNPEISIDIDVAPSTESDFGIPTSKYGKVELGKGVVIEYGPGKSRRLGDLFVKICKEKEIPYQIGVGRAGGTNTAAIQEWSEDCETMLLSIPNRSMHTPVEVVCWTDIEACINLITAYLEG